MGVPYETQPRGGLVVPAGETAYFEIGFPAKAWLCKIVVAQADGAGSFTVAIYNNESAAGGRPESVSLPAGGGPAELPVDLFRVTPDLPGTNGLMVHFSELASGGSGFLCFNQDLRPAQKTFGDLRKLYLQITAPAGGTFAVVLGGESYD